MSESEQRLLDEILFYYFIINQYKTSNPVKTAQLIGCLSECLDCNKMLISTACSDILAGKVKYSKLIFTYLLSKALPVRQVCKFLHCSMTTFYKRVNKFKEQYVILPAPVFDDATYAEVKKFLIALSTIAPLGRNEDGYYIQ